MLVDSTPIAPIPGFSTTSVCAASVSSTLPAAILESLLTGLAAILLNSAGGDMACARQAAASMLRVHNPQTEDELRLAVIIDGFSFRAIEALAQSAAPDLALTDMLRLNNSAVGLIRESAKAERRLIELRGERRDAATVKPASSERSQSRPVRPASEIERPLASAAEVAPASAMDAPRETAGAMDAGCQPTGKVAAVAKATGVSWTKAYTDRHRDLRIAASLARAEARVAAMAIAPIADQSRMAEVT